MDRRVQPTGTGRGIVFDDSVKDARTIICIQMTCLVIVHDRFFEGARAAAWWPTDHSPQPTARHKPAASACMLAFEVGSGVRNNNHNHKRPGAPGILDDPSHVSKLTSATQHQIFGATCPICHRTKERERPGPLHLGGTSLYWSVLVGAAGGWPCRAPLLAGLQ